MADLLALLSIGARSLTAHRAASATASHNLENANTPGYSRQRANLETVLPAYRLGGSFIGQGVELQTVSQARDAGVERQFASIHKDAARSKAESDALQSLSALDPQAAGNVGSAMADFYGAMRQLAQNPGDLSLRQGVLGKATDAALAFNRTAQGIDGARDALDSKIQSSVSQVNQLAQQMASLNRQVRTARASGAEPNDLLDARQQVQDQLEGLLGVVPISTSDGDVNLAFSNGAALVTGDVAGTVSTQVNAANGGHLDVQVTKPDGTGAATVSALGGTFGGWVTARDGALKTAETSLDTLAFDWAGALNTVHSAGFGLDGVSGRALFDPGATATGAASRLAVSAAVGTNPSLIAASASATTVPGDGTNLQALIGTERQALSNGSDALTGWGSLISNYGATAAKALSVSDADDAVLQHVSGLRDSVSGVSIDEEMIELTKAQRGYEAVMKVITTANEMLDTLMQLKS